MATFQDYLNELTKTTRHPIIKLEFLRFDESVEKTITTDLRLTGSLNINKKNGVRRSMSVSLDNVTKQYIPSLDSGIWLGRKVKLYLGLRVNGEDYFLPSGVFVMDDPTITSDGTTELNCIDKYSLLDGTLAGSIDSIIIINAGTTIANALQTIMTISQDPQPIIIDIALASETLPYKIIHEEGSTLGDIIDEIALAYSANVYYNEEGVLVFEKEIDDATKGSIWDFTVDLNETNYQGGNRRFKLSDVFNKIIVIGDNINGAIARASVSNNDLLSDTSIPNVGFERVKVITDNIIYNSTLALERGKYELKRLTVSLSELPISSIPLYHLDVDRVVKISDPYLDCDEKRLVINSISIPFNNSSMSLGLVDTFEINL